LRHRGPLSPTSDICVDRRGPADSVPVPHVGHAEVGLRIAAGSGGGSGAFDRGIELIVGLAHGVFGFLPMPNLTDALSASTPDSLRNRLVTYELRIGPGMKAWIKLGLAALDGGITRGRGGYRSRAS
jgi:hypothetical protein